MQCRTDQLLLLLQSHGMGIGLPGTPAGEATRSVGHFQCFVLLLHLTFALERNLVCVCVCVCVLCVCVCVCVTLAGILNDIISRSTFKGN